MVSQFRYYFKHMFTEKVTFGFRPILILFLLSISFSAFSISPKDWLESQFKSLNRCQRLLVKASTLFRDVDNEATERLAQIAFYNDTHAVPIWGRIEQPFILKPEGGFNIYLVEKSRNLEIEVLKSGKIRVSLRTQIWKLKDVKNSVEVEHNLDFLKSSTARSPEYQDYKSFLQIIDIALTKLRTTRLEVLKEFYETQKLIHKTISVEQMTTLHGAFVLKVKSDWDNRIMNTWILFNPSGIEYFVFNEINSHELWRSGRLSYDFIESSTLPSYTAFGGSSQYYQAREKGTPLTEILDVEKLWTRGSMEFGSAPGWVREVGNKTGKE
jgi:ASC-1-like (ASCH) protein